MNDELLVALAMIPAAIAARANYVRRTKGGKTKRMKFINKAKAAGAVTVGYYTGATYQYGDMTSDDKEMQSGSYVVNYEYEVGGRKYDKVLFFRTYGVTSVDTPNSVTIYYDPSNPKKCMTEQDEEPILAVRSGCLTSMVVFAVVLFCVFHLIRMLLAQGGL